MSTQQHTNSEYEPLLSSNINNTNQSKASRSKCNNATKIIARASRVRTSLFFMVILLIVIPIIIYAISQENKSSTTWVRMETSHPQPNHIPSSWTLKEECDELHPFTLTVALKQQNLEFLQNHVAAVSDPKNELFHKYWSPSQIRAYFKPSTGTIDTVTGWLSTNGFTIENGKINMENHGIVKVHLLYPSSRSNNIYPYIQNTNTNAKNTQVSITCGDANALLNTKYNFYENTKTGKTHLHVENGIYNIPESVVSHIDFISPTIRFPLKRHTLKMEPLTEDEVQAMKGSKHNNPKALTYNTPMRLSDLYQMTNTMDQILDGEASLDDSTIRQSIASFDDEYYSDDDLEAFWESFGLKTFSEMERVPADQPQGTGSEAELDVQYITSTGEGIYTYVYYVDSDSDPFLPLTEMILGQDVVPNALSISYGASEEELGEAYLQRCNAEFGKLALVGITILASSGDSGVVASDGNGECYDGFSPQFPASSIYVTAVGGSEGGVAPSSSGDASTGETAWYYSGGGFSKYFEAPHWQINAIETYLDTVSELPDSERYNSANAAYPDISAQSVAFIIVIDGNYYSVSGTSASCPTVAGMISMINYGRSQQGKTPLGLLNPILYELYENHSEDYYFNDVVEGYNEGCNDDNDIGFSAADGWDPVTGVGTPKFDRLYEALLAYD